LIFKLFQREVKADLLFQFFSKCGLIREIRLMLEFNNNNRGFCFIAFTNEADAQRAIEQYNESSEIHRALGKIGLKVGCSVTQKPSCSILKFMLKA